MYPVWWLAGVDVDDDADDVGEDGEDGPGMQMTRFKMSNMVIEVTFL